MTAPGRRPHIVIFNPDSWRGDVMGHLGDRAAITPNLDRMVSTDSVSFRYAFCQNPVCTPSRCSFMSGWYPHARGKRTMVHMMRRDEPVLLRTLKQEGYNVFWSGKNDLVPAQEGFDEFCTFKFTPDRKAPRALHEPKDWRGDPAGDRYYSFEGGRLEKTPGVQRYHDDDWGFIHGATDFIRSAPKDRPLCIFLPLCSPHPPYMVEEPFFSMIDRGLLPPRIRISDYEGPEPAIRRELRQRMRLGHISEDRWREVKAVYYGMCARVDHQFGLVMQALKDAGIYDDTAVFFFSDHGDYTGDFDLTEKTENTFEECMVRSPLVIKPPAGVPLRPGVRDEALVELIDFPATVFELTGIEPDWHHWGRSLLPPIAGSTEQHRDAVFCEGGRLRGEWQSLAYEHDWLPDEIYSPRLSLMHDDTGADGKAVMCRTKDFKYIYRLYETHELYDLRNDPHEMHNRIEDAALAGVLAQMRLRLLEWFTATGDVIPFDQDFRTDAAARRQQEKRLVDPRWPRDVLKQRAKKKGRQPD